MDGGEVGYVGGVFADLLGMAANFEGGGSHGRPAGLVEGAETGEFPGGQGTFGVVMDEDEAASLREGPGFDCARVRSRSSRGRVRLRVAVISVALTYDAKGDLAALRHRKRETMTEIALLYGLARRQLRPVRNLEPAVRELWEGEAGHFAT